MVFNIIIFFVLIILILFFTLYKHFKYFNFNYNEEFKDNNSNNKSSNKSSKSGSKEGGKASFSSFHNNNELKSNVNPHQMQLVNRYNEQNAKLNQYLNNKIASKKLAEAKQAKQAKQEEKHHPEEEHRKHKNYQEYHSHHSEEQETEAVGVGVKVEESGESEESEESKINKPKNNSSLYSYVETTPIADINGYIPDQLTDCVTMINEYRLKYSNMLNERNQAIKESDSYKKVIGEQHHYIIQLETALGFSRIYPNTSVNGNLNY